MDIHESMAGVKPPGRRETLQQEAVKVGKQGMVFVRKKKRHLCVCAVILTLALVAGLLYGVLGPVQEYDGKYDPQDFSGRKLAFESALVSVDAKAGNVVFNWEVLRDTGCDINAPDLNSPSCSPVNIFFDENLAYATVTSSITRSSRVPINPIFQWDPRDAMNPRANTPSFRTPITVVATRSAQRYPFDKYKVEVFLFAKDNATNAPVGVTVERTKGIASGFLVTATAKPDRKGPPPAGVLSQRIDIRRGTLIRAYSIIIVVAVWLISLVFVFATLLHLVFGYPLPVEFLVIPVATVFTVTQLRQTMPGAPDFGSMLDYAGLFPCLALMSFCATFTIGALAFLEHDKKRKTIFQHLLDRQRRSPMSQMPSSTIEAECPTLKKEAALLAQEACRNGEDGSTRTV